MSENTTLQHAVPTEKENVVHRTASRPFSFHRTVLEKGASSALYLHYHPEAEIFYLEQGMVDLQVENRSFSLRAGEGIFIPPGQIHAAVNRTDGSLNCAFQAVVFDLGMLESNLPPQREVYFAPLQLQRNDCVYPITFDKPENAGLLALLPSLFALRQTELRRYELALIGTLLLCWQELYNLCFSKLSVSVSDSTLHREIQKSMDFLQQHFQSPLTLAELSKKAGFSESYFCHSFKRCTGYTPFEYLNRLRIVKSCELLTQTNKKITEIASLCGFNNISYFNRIFCKKVGVSPSRYRNSSCSFDLG